LGIARPSKTQTIKNFVKSTTTEERKKKAKKGEPPRETLGGGGGGGGAKRPKRVEKDIWTGIVKK